MTPQQIKGLAQPLVNIYQDLTDELMVAIADQLATHGGVTDTAQWQIRKLAQAGQLDKRAVRLIADKTAICPDMTELMIEQAAQAAIADIEPDLLAYAKATGSVIPAGTATRWTEVLRTYQAQARDTLNLVNTVMAYKARDAYTGIVNKAADLANRGDYLYTLGKNTASVVTGQQSRQAALRQCIKEFSAKGLPGFADKSGREWSPEAYINMDIRTTVNNVAHEAQFARMDDYGSDLLEVSSHIGARPRCEPYQGRVYSRSGKTGYVEDLNGNRIFYTPWGETSYGEPAGLLGINCGHQVYPFYPGLSRQTYKPYSKAENDHIYAESQRQRALERQVRASKRECAMLDKMGDKEGFAVASARLKRREQSLRDFTEQTGRTLRGDRVQVPGFGRSQSVKAAAASRNLKIIAEDGKMKAASGLPKRTNLPDAKIPHTVAVDLPNLHGVVPRGASATEVYAMAGSGTSTPIRDLKRLYQLYPDYGPPSGWQKKSGTVYTDNHHYVVHWYENGGKTPPEEMKLKGAK